MKRENYIYVYVYIYIYIGLYIYIYTYTHVHLLVDVSIHLFSYCLQSGKSFQLCWHRRSAWRATSGAM